LHAIGDLCSPLQVAPQQNRGSIAQHIGFSSGIAEVKGQLAKGSWSGPVEQAAKPLRGRLRSRDKLIHSQDQSVRYNPGNETFLFRFWRGNRSSGILPDSVNALPAPDTRNRMIVSRDSLEGYPQAASFPPSNCTVFDSAAIHAPCGSVIL
jgi:hypothetical protein